MRYIFQAIGLIVGMSLGTAAANAADFNFYGRSGDAIAIDFGSLPGVASGAVFSDLLSGGRFEAHPLLTSSDLSQGTFSSDGRYWAFPDPNASSDTNAASRGFQGNISGSLKIDGVTKTFRITVQPGYTGAGSGSVGQNLEGLGRTNNPLFVAQQQQRLTYFGFVPAGAAPLDVTGTFDVDTDEATRTFQGVFTAGNNTTQASMDGIIGPNTAGWLNAANAPNWNEIVDPNPQVPGTFSVNGMIGDFDILPARDPGTGIRSGLTPQTERFGASWSIDMFLQGAADAKADTGRTQLMNGMSFDDGYGSSCCHSTHRVGLDIDVHADSSTHDFGNGFVDTEEQKVIDHAVAFIDAGLSGPNTFGRVQRIIASNNDIRQGINAVHPGIVISDASGVHLNHMHFDIGKPTQASGIANLLGDFNFDGTVDAADYTVWRDGLDITHTAADYNVWTAGFGASQSTSLAVPEPSACVLALIGMTLLSRKASRLRKLPEVFAAGDLSQEMD